MSSPERMPPEIGLALVKVMRALDPAKRSVTETEGERTYAYASADDIFAAVQKHLAEAGLLLEMLEAEPLEFVSVAGADGTATLAVQMKFLPVWNWFGADADNKPAAAAYENPRGVIPMLGAYQGMSTCAALRTTAEKTYLRALLKLPTAPGEQATGTPGEAEKPPVVYTRDEAQAPGGKSAGGAKTVKAANPLQLGEDESRDKADAIIVAMDAAATMADVPADKRIAAVDSEFRKAGATYARLRPQDQTRVKQHHTARMTSVVEQAAGKAA